MTWRAKSQLRSVYECHPCTTCGALPGATCRTYTGIDEPCWPHAARRRAAEHTDATHEDRPLRSSSIPEALDQLSTGSARTGPKPRAGETSSETLRFRCSPAEATEIRKGCAELGRDVSEAARELLLAYVRRSGG